MKKVSKMKCVWCSRFLTMQQVQKRAKNKQPLCSCKGAKKEHKEFQSK